MASFLWPQLSSETNPGIYWYQRSLHVVLMLCALGVCFLLASLSLSTDGLYDNGGCTDPFIQITTAPIQTTMAYQWLFVIYGSVILWLLVIVTALLSRKDPKNRVQSVYRCMCRLATGRLRLLAVGQALQPWKVNALGTHALAGAHDSDEWFETRIRPPAPWRKALFYLGHLPVVCLLSLPSMGYVLSQKCRARACACTDCCCHAVSRKARGFGIMSWVTRLWWLQSTSVIELGLGADYSAD